jgi:hypothetical protein
VLALIAALELARGGSTALSAVAAVFMLARISQGVRCIGAPDMIILFWNREMVIRGGVPRCRQSVAQRHTDLHA